VTFRLYSGRLLLTIAAATCGHGCDRDELAMAPSDLSTGVILYEHANYLGNSAHITADTPDLRDFLGPCLHGDDASTRDWNDCVSSVRVAPGFRATLYRDPDYHDDALEVTEDVANLQLIHQHDCPKGGFNDCLSSLRVRRQ
jgi:peptidase inhibitor family I36